MAQFIEMKLGQGSVLVEVAQAEESREQFAEVRGVLKKIDRALDNIIQQQIVEQCKVLEGAFEQLKDHSLSPKKVSVEFGLQFNAEGNVYIVKMAGQSNFKISFEWELIPSPDKP